MKDIRKAYVVFEADKEYPDAKEDYVKWINDRISHYDVYETLEDAKFFIQYLIEEEIKHSTSVNFFDEYTYSVNTYLYDYENDVFVSFLEEDTFFTRFRRNESSVNFDPEFMKKVWEQNRPDEYDECRDYMACNE